MDDVTLKELEKMDEAVLKELRAAKSLEEKAAIVAECLLNRLPREAALVARRCSILHWFDEPILESLQQEIPHHESSLKSIYEQITSLPFVESLPWGWAFNNLTREGLLRRYATSQPELLRTAARLAAPAYKARLEDDKSAAQAFFCYILADDASAALALLNTVLEGTTSRRNWNYINGLRILQAEAEELPSVRSLSLSKAHTGLLSHASRIQSELEVITREQKASRSRIKVWAKTYGAAITMGLIVVPIVASAATLGFYLSPRLSLFTQLPLNWYSVVGGALFTLIVWLVAAIFLSYFTTAKRANAHSYELLMNRVKYLETHLQVIQATREKFAQYQLIALEKASTNFQELDTTLSESAGGLSWVLGIGYMAAWSKLHRAEEALIEVDPIETVVRGAYHDRQAISNSQLDKSDDLLDRLHHAVKVLDPSMGNVVASSNPSADLVEKLQEVERQIQKIAQKLQINQDDDQDGNNGKQASYIPGEAANARVTIREIRRTLNDYRGNLWESLIRGRNLLMGIIFITGLMTYMLLFITIFAASPVNNGLQSERSAIVSAAAFYILGAIAGLFGRINQGAIANIAIDDYGFSFAQIIAASLFSGLAGIAGVLIYGVLVLQVASNASFTLSSTFTVNRPENLIAAAIFGLVPNLISQRHSNKYVSALRSSRASDLAVTSDEGDRSN